MRWLRRHSWWGLFAIAVLFVGFGIGDLLVGFTWDPGIPLGLVGLTPADLEGRGAEAYRMLEFGTRVGGLSLMVTGALFIAVLLAGFRRNQRWGWWTMWVMPAWMASISLLNLAFGVVPGQAPPPPMISGAVLAILAAAIQVISARRFFGAWESTILAAPSTTERA
ncbi:MAG: hypothetical protein M3406_05375 [Chloroflexota bacterium]|nr:hypothetical protein [Chloroflexota bacterium]